LQRFSIFCNVRARGDNISYMLAERRDDAGAVDNKDASNP